MASWYQDCRLEVRPMKPYQKKTFGLKKMRMLPPPSLKVSTSGMMRWSEKPKEPTPPFIMDNGQWIIGYALSCLAQG